MATENLHWRQIIKKHFGKRAYKHAKELEWNIRSVDAGIKISYLVDCFIIKTEFAAAFLKDINKQGLVHQSLVIIEIEDCIFISSLDNLQTGFDQLSKSFCILVDVSCDQKNPRLFSDSKSKDLFISMLDELKPQLTEGKVENLITLHLADHMNRSTVYGMLLGYPVVYWYKDILTAEHCLQMVELNVVSVTVMRHPESSSCVVYSFSYPSAFEESIKNRVDSWFQRIERLANEENVGKLVCKISKVLLPNVVL